jgi:hypothetical protein
VGVTGLPPPATVAAGGNDGESTIMGGSGGSTVDGWEDEDGGERLGGTRGFLRSTTVSLIGSGGLLGSCAPPSRELPSLGGVCCGATRASLNFEILWGTAAGAAMLVVVGGGGAGAYLDGMA